MSKEIAGLLEKSGLFKKNMNLIELNKQSYNKIAALFSGTRSYIWEDVDVLLKYVQPGDHVLDAGCGNGRLAGVLKDKAVSYTGIDNSEKIIDEARKNQPGQEFIVTDILSLDRRQLRNDYDAVFLVSVLNHFPRAEQDQAIQNIKELLKPGGYLLMVNWNLWRLSNRKSVWRSKKSNQALGIKNLKWRDVLTTWKGGNIEAPLYYYAFTKNEIEALLKRNGFSVIENFYSSRGEKSHALTGENIVTVGRK